MNEASKTPSVKKNYAYNLSYQILNLLTPFITTPYVSRVLGADGIGIYSYTTSIMAYFQMLAILGTTNYGIREIARLRDDKEAMSKAFWEIVILVSLTTSICLVCWLFFSFTSEFYRFFFLALTPLLLSSAFDISWFYTGIEKMGYTVVRNSICKLIGIISLFVFVHEKDDLLIYILLNSVISLLGNISMWSYLPKLVCKVPISKIRLKKHIKETMVYFIITIAISLYTVLDKVLIGIITNDNYQNGYYEQANKIINIAKTLSFTSLNFVMGARISYLFAHNNISEIHKRIDQSTNIIFFLEFGCIFGICSISDNFVPVFFGPGYEPVINMLYLMSPLIFFISLSTCLGSHYYIPAGKIKKSTKMTIQGSIINLIANCLLIPIFGAKGAVIGSLIGEGIIAIMYCYFAKEYLPLRLIIRNSYKKIIAGCAMFIIAKTISLLSEQTHIKTLSIQIPICMLVYLLLLYIMKDMTIVQIVNMLKLWKRK